MESSSDVERIHEEVERLNESLDLEQDARRRRVRSKKIVTGLFVAVALGFVFINGAFFISEWTGDKLEESFERELSELSPFAVEEANALARTLLPIYAEEARSSLQAFLPKLTETDDAPSALYPRYAAEVGRLKAFVTELRDKPESELTDREEAQKEVITSLLQLPTRQAEEYGTDKVFRLSF